jgi:hypothetical protein
MTYKRGDTKRTLTGFLNLGHSLGAFTDGMRRAMKNYEHKITQRLKIISIGANVLWAEADYKRLSFFLL